MLTCVRRTPPRGFSGLLPPSTSPLSGTIALIAHDCTESFRGDDDFECQNFCAFGVMDDFDLTRVPYTLLVSLTRVHYSYPLLVSCVSPPSGMHLLPYNLSVRRGRKAALVALVSEGFHERAQAGWQVRVCLTSTFFVCSGWIHVDLPADAAANSQTPLDVPSLHVRALLLVSTGI